MAVLIVAGLVVAAWAANRPVTANPVASAPDERVASTSGEPLASVRGQFAAPTQPLSPARETHKPVAASVGNQPVTPELLPLPREEEAEEEPAPERPVVAAVNIEPEPKPAPLPRPAGVRPPPQAKAKPAVDRCFGTRLEFAVSPAEAYRKARNEKKLVFLLHVSGQFEKPEFT
jgi:hypothetical protein